MAKFLSFKVGDRELWIDATKVMAVFPFHHKGVPCGTKIFLGAADDDHWVVDEPIVSVIERLEKVSA